MQGVTLFRAISIAKFISWNEYYNTVNHLYREKNHGKYYRSFTGKRAD